MRYTAAEKLESEEDQKTIQCIVFPTNPLVEQSHLSVRRSLEQIGIPRATFYRW